METTVEEIIEYVQGSIEIEDLNLIKLETESRIEAILKTTIKPGEIVIVRFGEKSMFKRFNGKKVKVTGIESGKYVIEIPDGKKNIIEHRVPLSVLTKIKIEA